MDMGPEIAARGRRDRLPWRSRVFLARNHIKENPKSEYRNSKQIRMSKTEEKTKQYDLEERTFEFANNVREFVKSLPRTVTNEQDIRQLVRASGSVGANYIEANESLSKKDFVMRIKISRKEAKESRYWLRLLDTGDKQSLDKTRVALIQEASELMNIFGSIVRRSE
jgi:four helix bundle protein